MNEQGQSQSVVLAVICFLGTVALGGLAGLVFLIWTGADATALLAVSNPTMTALGGLGAMLVTTKSNPPAPIQQAQAVGYAQAVEDVAAFNAPVPAPVAPVVAPEPP